MKDWSLESLNPVQREIIEHKNGALLVIAGAGSGKTRVITHRVAHLINSNVPASSILLLTFTNKAANEISQRVERAVKKTSDKQKIIHGTFHSVGSRFLRRSAKLLKYNNNLSWFLISIRSELKTNFSLGIFTKRNSTSFDLFNVVY